MEGTSILTEDLMLITSGSTYFCFKLKIMPNEDENVMKEKLTD